MPKGKPKKGFTIRWKDSERAALLREAAKLILEGSASKSDALWVAQRTVLPPERHREADLLTPSGSPWFVAAIEEYLDQARARRDNTPPSPAATPELAAVVALESAPPLSFVEMVGEAIGKIIAKALVCAITSPELREAASSLLDRSKRMPDPPPPATATATAAVSEVARPKLPKVVVIGNLSGANQSEVKNAFTGRLDISCVEASSIRKIQSSVQHAAVVVAMTSLISHQAQNSARSMCENVKLVPGGVRALKESLEIQYSNMVAQQQRGTAGRVGIDQR